MSVVRYCSITAAYSAAIDYIQYMYEVNTMTLLVGRQEGHPACKN